MYPAAGGNAAAPSASTIWRSGSQLFATRDDDVQVLDEGNDGRGLLRHKEAEAEQLDRRSVAVQRFRILERDGQQAGFGRAARDVLLLF